ncbi:restriction endonuclease subunit S [uncultured Clostridium sp.]|uniref:restriction endonuclease subunit S n=1 Tax=uncultured Clostridium sp. TaxID=59620 RepID=UPI0027DDFF0D|nr:restriction endonuclease subunit S [uncultured Clostridium sp.]
MKNNNWKKKELGEIIEIKKEKYNPIKEQVDYPCIELEHINQNIGSINGYTRAKLQSSIKNKFYKGDVLYGKLRPYLRKYHFAKFEGVCSSEIWVLNGKDIKNEYLFYLVQDERFNNIANVSTGSKMPRADWTFMERYPFNIPPKEEQDRIVEILSTWDLAIEKQEQLIEKKKEFKKGLMQRLLSGEVRFKNFKDDWKTYKVNNLTKQVINKNKDGNISLVLSVTNKKGFITQEEQFEKQVASKDLSNYKIVRKGEFAYNPSRINVGSIDLLTKFNEGLLSPMYIVFKCDEQLLSEYYNYWIKTNMFKKQMDKYLSGSVRETLSFEDMGLMKIKLPSMEEQKMIVDLLNNMNTEIELLEKELEALKLQKKGLMQKLLTGEVRVKV